MSRGLPNIEIALIAMLSAGGLVGCYQSHELEPIIDAGMRADADRHDADPLDASEIEDTGRVHRDACVVRWYCYCDDAGACGRWDGSRCQPGDLRDPADDPCRR